MKMSAFTISYPMLRCKRFLHIIYVVVTNAPIPSTDGAGTRIYLICGACLIAANRTVIVVSPKSNSCGFVLTPPKL